MSRVGTKLGKCALLFWTINLQSVNWIHSFVMSLMGRLLQTPPIQLMAWPISHNCRKRFLFISAFILVQLIVLFH